MTCNGARPREAPLTPDALDAIVAQAQAGDAAAFGRVVAAIEGGIRGFLRSRTRHEDLVDEAFQAALVSCYQQLARYELRGTFMSWMTCIAFNHLRSQLRERARWSGLGGAVLDRLVTNDDIRQVDESEMPVQARLQGCIDRLPAAARDLLRRRYAESMSVKHLAVAMARTETWVSVRLFRLRAQLRECLQRGDERICDFRGVD